MINFCTLFDSHYLDKGLALYQSLEKVSNKYNLFLFCFDDISYSILAEMNLKHVILIHHSVIETPQLLKLKEERSKAEYCWTCTPVVIEYVLEKYEVDSCTYIDADLYFFQNPEILYSEIREAGCNIVVTEHRFPYSWRGKKWLRKSGKYCVEFNYFDQSENARRALKWWKEKCFEWCFALYEPDRMGDQKYLEQFPKKFQGVHELQHLGGGVAPWNLGQYSLVENQNKIVLLNKETEEEFELIFYHFQNIKYITDNKVNINSGTNDRRLKESIYQPYLKELTNIREYLLSKYNLKFEVKKSYSSNRIKAFFQKNLTQYKVKSISDIVDLEKYKRNCEL